MRKGNHDAKPGDGPRLHRHPYAEVFIKEEPTSIPSFQINVRLLDGLYRFCQDLLGPATPPTPAPRN